jgi:hypothetical protein
LTPGITEPEIDRTIEAGGIIQPSPRTEVPPRDSFTGRVLAFGEPIVNNETTHSATKKQAKRRYFGIFTLLIISSRGTTNLGR